MPPYPESNNSVYTLPRQTEQLIQNEKNLQKVHKSTLQKYEVIWLNVWIFIVLHGISLYGIYLIPSARFASVIFYFSVLLGTALTITTGAHRLWSHRSYKAKLPLKLLLLLGQTMAQQNSVIEWCRDHRAHHKFEETNADPHNSNNGFFFSHMGWLMCKKHEDVKIKGKGIDLSDLYADPLLRFQHKHFVPLVLFFFLILPNSIPMLLWNETFKNAFCLNMLRYVGSLHITWLVNSWAHWYGNKPYDKNARATQSSFVSFFAAGEGWHNYHHAFPWDYRASEFKEINPTLSFINMCAKIGWAYDLKYASEDMIKSRVIRTGDGTHPIWGWGDKDQTEENKRQAIIYN